MDGMRTHKRDNYGTYGRNGPRFPVNSLYAWISRLTGNWLPKVPSFRSSLFMRGCPMQSRYAGDQIVHLWKEAILTTREPFGATKFCSSHPMNARMLTQARGFVMHLIARRARGRTGLVQALDLHAIIVADGRGYPTTMHALTPLKEAKTIMTPT